MKTIVLIGAGQLGSRHLQSLALIDIDVKLQVVDPFQESLKIARERFEAIQSNPKISIQYFTSIDTIDSNIDLCIIATTADVRKEIIKDLIHKKDVKRLILEKVLFQKLKDFDEIQFLLENNNISCWVNHPFRCYPIYKKLTQYFSDKLPVSYQIIGGDWGLACNGLHYLDHLAFLTNSFNLEINTSFLDKGIFDSKRRGFSEFSGKLIGTIGDNNFVLQSDKYFNPLTMTIQNEKIKVILDEASDWIKIAKKENNWKWEYLEEKIMYFQSGLTHLVVKDIFEKNTCDLPSYRIASKLHKPFLKALLNHQNLVLSTPDNDICPIT